jgi:hypothetical protein
VLAPIGSMCVRLAPAEARPLVHSDGALIEGGDRQPEPRRRVLLTRELETCEHGGHNARRRWRAPAAGTSARTGTADAPSFQVVAIYASAEIVMLPNVVPASEVLCYISNSTCSSGNSSPMPG